MAWTHGNIDSLHLVVSCPASRNVGTSSTYIITASPSRRTTLQKGKEKGSRDKISESLMRMLSGISEAILDLMSKLSRSCPPTSCFPTVPDPSESHSAITADFLFWISWDPVCWISLKPRSRTRLREVCYKEGGSIILFLPTERNAYDVAEKWEEELDSKERIRRGGERQNRADGPVNIILLLSR